jgi:hypothetical protein
VARRGQLHEPIDVSATAQEQAAAAAWRVDLNKPVIGQSHVHAIARTAEQRSSARSARSDEESLTLLGESEPNRGPQPGLEIALRAVPWCGLVNRCLRPGNSLW